MIKFFKNLILVFSIISILLCCFLPCFASNYTTYSDVLQNNSTVNNLLSLRSDSQSHLDYVVFRQSPDQYMLVMSDSFVVNNKVVSAENCYVIYYNSEYGSNNSTRYFSTSESSFSLKVNHVVVSNFLDFSSKNETTNWQKYILIVVCLILAFVIFNVIRRFK